ncbi:uncharacterized protein LOC136091074 [Hydra vulgaris]|uniref:Uncharacterized protein LOC136091074 n=1 Tax=Hydra vulgaris TaxID=6087 RepID=A0ABM4DI03_HYDVU
MHQFERDITHNGYNFKAEHDLLPDKYNICKKRLANLRNRLNNKKLVAEYNQIFIEYENNNIIERVSEYDIFKEPGCVHYLPHRPVMRRDKDTTKIRAVFDASCFTTGPSLNDCLYSGPNLLSKMFDILLKFRFNAIGIIADIKQEFLNIETSYEHRDYLSFLWYERISDKEDKLIVYRFLRVVFGLTCCPFLLNATIRHHLNKYLKNDKIFIERLIDDLYVGYIGCHQHMTSGCETVLDGKMFYKKSKSIFLDAGFELRNEVMKNKYNNNNLIKILGIEWDIVKDEFVFEFKDFVKKDEAIKTTKRNILKMAASFFDPLGFITPITSREVLRVLNGRVKFDNVICWCDSEVALYWIKEKKKTWKPWVENRVNAIRKIVDRQKWNHISGKLNPANFPTRISNFVDLGWWLKGPEFLLNMNEKIKEFTVDNELNVDIMSECKRGGNVVVCNVVLESSPGLSSVIDASRFSSFEKLIITTAYVFRFINNLVKTMKKLPLNKQVILTTDEYKYALNE